MTLSTARRPALVAMLAALLVLALAGVARADVTGVVTTPGGAPLPGILIDATTAGGGYAGAATTDGAGAYRLEVRTDEAPPPYTVTARDLPLCDPTAEDEVKVTATGVGDGEARNFVLDLPAFCTSDAVPQGQPEATGLVRPGEVLVPPGGRVYLTVQAPYDASGFVVTLPDGTVLGRGEYYASVPLVAPATPYSGPFRLTYTYKGVASTRVLGKLIVAAAPAPVQPSGPFDLAAIVDLSGSMGQADPTNRRRDAVQLLVDLAAPGDRVAAIGFDESLHDVFGRTRIAGAAVRARLKRLAAQKIGSFGGTNYDIGFKAAYEAMSAAPLNPGTPKGAIFLTDGAHNGAYQNSHLLFAYNGTGASWPVCVVQLGTEFDPADTARLQRIASDTGGTFVKTPTNTELENLYFQCRGKATGAATLLRKTQTFKAGQRRTYGQTIKKGQRKATFFVSHGAGKYQLRLVQPGGRVFKRSVGKRVRLVSSRTFSFFEVQQPKPGRWRLMVKRLRTGGPQDNATTTITVQRKVKR